MLPRSAVFLAPSDPAAGCLKQSLRHYRGQILGIQAVDLLGCRLTSLDDLRAFAGARSHGSAVLYEGAWEMPVADNDLAALDLESIMEVIGKLRDDRPLYVAIGTTARDFAALAYVLALCRVAAPSRTPTKRPIFRLAPSLRAWPCLGETAPNSRLGQPDGWSPVPERELKQAERLWTVMTAPGPGPLNAMLEDAALCTQARAAVQAFAGLFPHSLTGLTTWDSALLEAIEGGRGDVDGLLGALIYRQTGSDPGNRRLFLTRLRHLSSGTHPLVGADGEIGFARPKTNLKLSRWGRSVLEGSASALELLRHDYWVGAMLVSTLEPPVLVRNPAPAGSQSLRATQVGRI